MAPSAQPVTPADNPSPAVIFDFDGTLADTFVTSIRIFEKLTNKSEPYDDTEISRLRSLTAFAVVRELRIRPWRVPWLLVRGRQMMRREIENIVVFQGIQDVLERLRVEGIPIYIMSSNSPGNIRKLMQARGLEHYFTHIYGNVGLFGKARKLRKLLEANSLDAAGAFYVGDEGRDIEAAKRVGVRSVAVSWGFNSPELLERHHPYAIAHSPQGLAEILLGTSD